MLEREKRTMIKTIPATEARIHFGEIIKRVYRGREQLIVEKDGLPVVVILSHTDYEEYRRLLALQQFEKLSKDVNREMRAKGITEEQALADLEKTQRKVFQEKYGPALRSHRRKAN